MKNIVTLLTLFLFANVITAQKEIEYVSPSLIEYSNYTVLIENIIAKSDYCKFRLVIKNTSDGYLFCDLKKIKFDYKNKGSFYPERGKFRLILPGEDIAATILVEKKIDFRIDRFTVSLEGLSHAPLAEGIPVALANTNLEQGKQFKAGDFEMDIVKSFNKKDNFYFTINTTFNGGENEFGTLTCSEMSIKSKSNPSIKANIVPRKIICLNKGENYNISGDFESREQEFHIEWGATFTKHILKPIAPSPIALRKVGLSELKPDNKTDNNHTVVKTNKTVDNTHTVSSNENMGSGGNEVSSEDGGDGYNGRTKCSPENVTNGQFRDMKQQINKENSDRDKIAVAKNLVRANCMTAAQIAELCKIFSNDEQRFDLAKYAFEFTYDIDNYFVVVNLIDSQSMREDLRKHAGLK